MTESLKGAATTAGRQISAELTERRSQPSGAGARRAARLWRTSGAFEGCASGPDSCFRLPSTFAPTGAHAFIHYTMHDALQSVFCVEEVLYRQVHMA